MSEQYLHTPEGVRDIYGEECAKKLAIEAKISDVFHSYGYEDIETPIFEFFDIFREERGSVDSREMYKFFDRENNTLVLRPDLTPSIARCVARYYRDETEPVRLCYCGPTFLNSARYQGHAHQTTQTGVELIGDNSVDADAEMIAMVIDSLKASGLSEFQVEVGEVDFFRGLMEEAGISDEDAETLRNLIERKNFFGVQELLNRTGIRGGMGKLLLKLPELFGDIKQIGAVKKMTDNPRATAAVERLEKLQEILNEYGLGDYVSYDLGMLSNYGYYTGLIFMAYTYGSGDYIVTGGRYDNLLTQFGKDAPAIGFAIVIDSLQQSLQRQDKDIRIRNRDVLIIYPASARGEAVRLAKELRQNGMSVVTCLLKSGEKAEKAARTDSEKRTETIITFGETDGKVLMYDVRSDSLLPFDKDTWLKGKKESIN